ncbi:MAG: hypothetical protein H8K06_02015 [Nitrospira sp.]|jgi:hypothetical protein|uniref:PilZ domain-containing protein n=1 Tax=Nitrospira defluvii TaxID=330214 RepID=A0ABM8QM88_9BACT|nr:hypothetical protein [Nitrospira defluvii]MCS6325857.1 hypothetical protein [Nitrospira sp.]CAE6705164.1 conserved hypothetical protein [Nitrospira defluvii]
MAADFIHRILKSLQDTFVPTTEALPPIVDNRTEQPMPPSVRDRRIDTRFAVRTPCTYELMEEHGSDASTLLGKAYSLNVSSDGILLLLDQKPQSRQLLSLQNPALQRQRSLTLFEVRWSTHLPVGATHPRYLVGCRLAFGRFPYFLVQRQHLDRDISGLSL